ncbi:DNA damage-regulated autophagy modulator protein 1-like [Dermatophagoides pteronyssinus]|uniref:DNA damage-regulated autophagy modulator protein 1-like n=1 Tax=Dermatophagoides pteronyssinus TaxID=6956 RepID=UPI003F6807ED
MNHQQSSKLRLDQKFLLILIQNAWILPTIISALCIAGCLVPYILSVHYERVYPILPYISDAGARLPAAAYFSQILDFAGVIAITIFWLRFLQINYYLTVSIVEQNQQNFELDNMEKQSKTITNNNNNNEKLIKRLHLCNLIILIVGIIGSFSLISIGNFRESENLAFHNTSVMILAGSFSILMIGNIIVAYYLNRKFQIESLPITWIILEILTHIAIFNLIISVLILLKINPNVLLDSDKRANWQPNMDGYLLHLSSTISEYLFFIIHSIVFLIFAKRFYQFKHWDKILFKIMLN